MCFEPSGTIATLLCYLSLFSALLIPNNRRCGSIVRPFVAIKKRNELSAYRVIAITGKGIVPSTLLTEMFTKLALGATNVDSNSHLPALLRSQHRPQRRGTKQHVFTFSEQLS